MTKTTHLKPQQSIRGKLLLPLLAMIGIFALVSFFSYYSEQLLLVRINKLLTNNISLKDFSNNVDNMMISLEKYLISRNFDMLREYYRYSQEIDAEYGNLSVVEENKANFLLLENVRYMTRSFLKVADQAEQAKRARDSTGYHRAFLEVTRYGANIKWAIDRLITNQLEENSRQYLHISEELGFIQRLGLLLIIAALLFSGVITVWTSFGLTKPLRKLAERAGIISQGNLTLAPLEVSTNDEIAVVTTAFNDMTTNITKLITEIKRQSNLEIRLQEQELQNLTMKNIVREAELHALQSQINPHFLFNVLNAGVQLAILENAENTADFIDKVSTLLRYNLRKLDTPVTIQEEADHLETYFYILKTRYGKDRIRFRLNIDPLVAEVQIPLLTLQPIVENALIHGVEDLEEGGLIEVRAFLEGNRVKIEVSDNGNGIDQTTLQKIQTGAKMTGHTTGLGLHNVRERLRLFFNGEDEFDIQSALRRGTMIQLSLPYRPPARLVLSQ